MARSRAALSLLALGALLLSACGSGGSPPHRHRIERPTPLHEPAAPTPPVAPASGHLSGRLVPGAFPALPALLSVKMVNPSIGWAILQLSQSTAVARTVDGGRTWTTEFVTPTPAVQVDAPSADVVFALLQGCGAGGTCNDTSIIASFDGGQRWVTVYRSHNFFGDAISFPSSQQGFLVGTVAVSGGLTRGVLLATRDGGTTWTSRASPCDRPGAAALFFRSGSEGWLLCGAQPGAGTQNKSLYRTFDGGADWTLVSSSLSGTSPAVETDMPVIGYVHSIFFLSAQQGWIGLDRGGIFETDDGGAQWRPVWEPPLPQAADQAFSVGFTDPFHGYMLAGEGPPLYTTSDGGRSWSVAYPPPSPTASISFLAPDSGYGAGWTDDGAMVLRTQDGGRTWSRAGDAPVQVSALEVLGPDAILVAGEQAIYRSLDGGSTWSVSLLPAGWYPAALAMVNQDFGWVVGYSPVQGRVLYVTEDGGQNWQPLPAPFSPEAVAPLGAQAVLAAGPSNVAQVYRRSLNGRLVPVRLQGGVPYLWRSNDGGRTWTVWRLPGWRLGESTPVGMRVGNGGLVWMWSQGRIWLSDDGGASFEEIAFRQSLDITDLSFTDPSHGWLLTTAGNLYATSDGGAVWQQITSSQVY